MEKVLITGIAGGQGRLLARRLLENFEVCGVDRVSWEGAPRGVRVHSVDLRKKKFEDVIRTELPTAIVHMGFVRHFRGDQTTRHDVNVRGTKQLLDHCVNHGVQKLVVISSSYVYGAFPENPYFMDEDSPLSASRSYAEIRDLVEVDTLASAFLWRYPHVRTCVLRPVNVLGYYVHSMIGQYLGVIVRRSVRLRRARHRRADALARHLDQAEVRHRERLRPRPVLPEVAPQLVAIER